MIAAPVGDDVWLEHVARRLAGQQLKALNQKTPELGVDEDGRPKPGSDSRPASPQRRRCDPCVLWFVERLVSFTPVILPGYDDHKPGKTRKLDPESAGPVRRRFALRIRVVGVFTLR